MENLLIDRHRTVFLPHQAIEDLDRLQGMLVRGVAVEKLMLNETGQGTELGQVTPEKPHPVHLPQAPCHASLPGENRLEGLPVVTVVAEGLVDHRKTGLDDINELRAHPQTPDLRMLEEPHQAPGVLIENIRAGA